MRTLFIAMLMLIKPGYASLDESKSSATMSQLVIEFNKNAVIQRIDSNYSFQFQTHSVNASPAGSPPKSPVSQPRVLTVTTASPNKSPVTIIVAPPPTPMDRK